MIIISKKTAAHHDRYKRDIRGIVGAAMAAPSTRSIKDAEGFIQQDTDARILLYRITSFQDAHTAKSPERYGNPRNPARGDR